LAQEVSDIVQTNNSTHRQGANDTILGNKTWHSRRKWILPAVALIASFLLFVLLTNGTGLFKTDVVYAMEKAVAASGCRSQSLAP